MGKGQKRFETPVPTGTGTDRGDTRCPYHGVADVTRYTKSLYRSGVSQIVMGYTLIKLNN